MHRTRLFWLVVATSRNEKKNNEFPTAHPYSVMKIIATQREMYALRMFRSLQTVGAAAVAAATECPLPPVETIHYHL